MENNIPTECPTCGSPVKKIPAGVSRAGKPYDEFWACSNRDCKFTYNKPKVQMQNASSVLLDIQNKVAHIYKWVKDQEAYDGKEFRAKTDDEEIPLVEDEM